MPSPNPRLRRRRGILVGVRVQESDGHRRVSRGDDFVALGGDREGHEHLRETCAAISDEVRRRGRYIADVDREEFREILERAVEKTGPAPV